MPNYGRVNTDGEILDPPFLKKESLRKRSLRKMLATIKPKLNLKYFHLHMQVDILLDVENAEERLSNGSKKNS